MFQDEECCHEEFNIQRPKSDSPVVDLKVVSVYIFIECLEKGPPWWK